MPRRHAQPVLDVVALGRARLLARSGEATRIRQAFGFSHDDIAAGVGGLSASTEARWERGSLPRGQAGVRWGELLANLAQIDTEVTERQARIRDFARAHDEANASESEAIARAGGALHDRAAVEPEGDRWR
jgi:transcriptional regulator with XRE-family HTH domain